MSVWGRTTSIAWMHSASTKNSIVRIEYKGTKWQECINMKKFRTSNPNHRRRLDQVNCADSRFLSSKSRSQRHRGWIKILPCLLLELSCVIKQVRTHCRFISSLPLQLSVWERSKYFKGQWFLQQKTKPGLCSKLHQWQELEKFSMSSSSWSLQQ